MNFGDLSKPATTLIEKISSAIGTIYEPTRVKRLAKADVEEKKIKEIGRQELNELQRRAVERLIYEETRKQQNIESITSKCIPYLNEDAKAEDIEDDWLSYFFEKMQKCF